MNSTVQIIESLELKVRKLMQLHAEAEKEKARLSIENKGLLKTITEQKKNIEELQEKNKVVRLAKSLNSESENTQELKLKINELVREIDKCTALLNR